MAEEILIKYNDLKASISSLKAATEPISLIIDASEADVNCFTGSMTANSDIVSNISSGNTNANSFNITLKLPKGTTNISYCFANASWLKKINFTGNTENVFFADYLFNDCSSLQAANLDSFFHIWSMNGAFNGCSSISNIDWRNTLPLYKENIEVLNSANNLLIYTSYYTRKLLSNAGIESVHLSGGTEVPEIENMSSEVSYDDLGKRVMLYSNDKIHELDIDMSSIDSIHLKGDSSLETASIFSDKFSLADEGVKFNINVRIPDSTNDISYCLYNNNRINKANIILTNNSLLNNCEHSLEGSSIIEFRLDNCKTIFNTNYMLKNCKALKIADISKFDNPLLTADSMFEGCTALKEINWGNIEPSSKTNIFSGTSQLNIMVNDYKSKTNIDDHYDTMGLVAENYHIKGNPDKVVIADIIRYNDLDFYIPCFKPGIYDLIVDCKNVDKNQFIGDNSTNKPSKFAEKLLQADNKVFFDLKFGLPDDVIDASYCFSNNDPTRSLPLTSINITKANNLENASYMFNNLNFLASSDISAFKKVNNAEGMFEGCSTLYSVDWGTIRPENHNRSLSGINTKIVINSLDYEVNRWIEREEEILGLTPGNYEVINKESLPIPNVIKYNDMNLWIPYLNEGLYDITIDCANVPAEKFLGTSEVPSDFNNQLNNNNKNALFNLKFSVPEGVENISYCFNGNTHIKEVRILKENDVTNSSYMFNNCSNLTLVDTSILTNVTNSEKMLEQCTSLRTVYATNETVFEKGADLLTCNSLHTIYTNKEVKNYLVANKKIPEINDIKWYSLKEKVSFAKEEKIISKPENKHIVGNLFVNGKVEINDGHLNNVLNDPLSLTNKKYVDDMLKSSITDTSDALNRHKSQTFNVHGSTSDNVKNSIVQRDKEGNFSANEITADVYKGRVVKAETFEGNVIVSTFKGKDSLGNELTRYNEIGNTITFNTDSEITANELKPKLGKNRTWKLISKEYIIGDEI